MSNDIDVCEVLGRHILADGMQTIFDLEQYHGCWIVDRRDGRQYLDMDTMYASTFIRC